MPSDVGQVAIHPQEMVIAPKGVILGHVEHLLDNAKEGDLDLGPEPGQHRKDNARSPRAAKASRTDKGPCEHLQVVLAVSSLAADPMEVVRMIRQSSRITTFFKGPFASGTSSGEEHEEHGQVDASVYQSDQKSPPDHDGNANVEALSTSKQQVHFFAHIELHGPGALWFREACRQATRNRSETILNSRFAPWPRAMF